jgi:hypothetical protein
LIQVVLSKPTEHFVQKIKSFNADFDDFKTMARLMDSASSSQRQPSHDDEDPDPSDPADFSHPCLMALRLRASQKQVLWEVMLSLLKSEG